MYGNFIFLILFSLLIFVNGQSADERNYPIARYLTSRTSKASFDTEFPQGRCPRRFYQLGNECVYFGIDGKSYGWKQADRICSKRIAGLLDEPSSVNNEQPNMKPTNGLRQLVLNTPEKTDILRALYRDYYEQNFAVRLPSDYDTLQRCNDGKDDKWPQYCPNSQFPNSTCFETISTGANDICLNPVECNKRNFRLSCEFTLPGSDELTASKFRHCSIAAAGRSRYLPKWAWIAIIIGAILLLLTILAVIVSFIRKSKTDAASKKKPLPEPRQAEEKVIRIPVQREDPAAEPMLIRAAPTNVPDTSYLQPRSSSTENTANA